MENFYGFLSNISRDLVCGAVNQIRYPCCFNNFVKELKREEDDLIATRNSVQSRVNHAEKQKLETAIVVQKWLETADIRIKDVNNLLNDKAIIKKSCCYGHCPNWILRHHFGRKFANKRKEIQEFIKNGKQIEQFHLDKYLKFESREHAFKQVMEAVKDKEINMIGLYGIGGCGKTTLAEEVKKIAEAQHLFDKVLFVTVSSTVEVGRIQERIASSMQYTFTVNEVKERATALCVRLTEENKILVILDDVWERLDLGAIGIPLTEHHKGCKVLITTRSEDVCTRMDCQEKIQLHILKDEEAWILFKRQAHISEDTSENLKHLGREFSNKCKGLPVAIAAVAGSLKGKHEVIWNIALNRLINSEPMNIENGPIDLSNCLQLCYDILDTEEAQSLFLLCSVFPEDYKIPIEYLTRIAIGLGVVGEFPSYGEARSEVIAAKIKLVSSSLLMCGANDEGDEFVKMHDIVRAVAHLIAKEENKVIKCELENDVTLEESSVRYLWCNEFPNDMDYSNLEFLRISTKLEILDENFERMGELRVLILCNDREDNNKQPLSTMSFKTLTNLRCLFLMNWELSDISFLRYTKKLQSLSLDGCSLQAFLDTINWPLTVSLSELRELRMGYMNNLIVLWLGWYWTLSKVEKLYLEHCPELQYLSTGAPITAGLLIGNYLDMPRFKSLEIFSCPKLSTLSITFTSLEKLNIEDCDGLNHIISYNVVQRATCHELKIVKVERCAKLEVILPLSYLRKLESLEIRECKELKQIMQQNLKEDKDSTQPHLSKLTKLVVEKCPKLKHVFSPSASIDLSNLEILIINGVTELEELIGCEHGKGHEIEKSKVELPKLKLTIFVNLPNLCQGIELLHVKHRIVHNCPKLSLTSTTTLQKLYEDFPHSDFENAKFSQRELRGLIDQINASNGETLTLSTGVEDINLGGGIVTHTKSSDEDILAQGSQVLEKDDKLNEINTVTRTRLEAYKHFVDLDDTQIALLVETIAVHPHLWNSCQKFSERFQAWMLKTLADMLLLLRNESANGVTPQREKEFHKLCDEAIKLGFDSSWVDEMRKHVVARDPMLEEDRAQTQIN